uniref:Uncharacterized protein n=1 Tax=Setaria digitata TaxID=48799 RepID=A0A915PLZ1_9BILA
MEDTSLRRPPPFHAAQLLSGLYQKPADLNDGTLRRSGTGYGRTMYGREMGVAPSMSILVASWLLLAAASTCRCTRIDGSIGGDRWQSAGMQVPC